jgi:hypothetical protein
MSMNRLLARLTPLLILLAPLVARSQAAGHQTHSQWSSPDIPGICEGCGAPSDPAAMWLLAPAPGWGFNYDSLKARLATWRGSPYVTVDSIGASVNNRALWELTITSTATPAIPRKTVYIHARTHPGEVQVTWVGNAMIDYLLSDQEYARLLRERLTFHIVPMYNPDGVELESARWNAHGVDLERDWDTDTPEPEVASLKRRFVQLMASPAPIEVALNLHSAIACKRYFVFHDPKGTSNDYADDERRFITGARSHFATGLEPWSYNVTWDTGTPRLFPESWWWRTQGRKVMALTYEDMNCTSAGEYDSTAYAILHGVGDYLGVAAPPADVAGDLPHPATVQLVRIYPNPLSNVATILYSLPRSTHVTLQIADLLGRVLETVVDEEQTAGTHREEWYADEVPSGVYICYLQAGGVIRSSTLRVAR